MRFGCPRCQVRLFARPSQVGAKRRCPRCQHVFTVPTAEQAAALAGKQGPDAEYAVTDSSALPAEPPAIHVTVVCPLCKTRMYATADQVGQLLICPDCETRVVVPPPPALAVEKTEDRPVDITEEYPLWGIEQPPREHKEAYQTFIPVVCGLCHTRLHATLDQVGQQLICPDCETSNTVPPPPKKLPKIDPMADAGEDLTYSAPIRPPEFQPIFEYSWLKELEEPEPDKKDRPRAKRAQATPSAGALFSGTFGFLFQQAVLTRWITFSAAGIITLAFAGAAIRFAMIDSLPSMIVSLLFSMTTGILLVLSLSLLATSLTAVVVDMAAGNERMENWPEGTVADWVLGSFYVFNAAAISVAPGALLRWLLGRQDLSPAFMIELSVFAVFPVVFLSMLERGSVVAPYSSSILRSLRSSFAAWGLFYLLTGLLLVATGSLVSGLAALLGGLGIALATPAVVAAVLLYFRLLGRLAWIAAYASEEEEDGALANREPTGQDRP